MVSKEKMKIRRFTTSDTPRLIELFQQTVHTVCRKDYTQEQLSAWAPDSIDVNRWTVRFENTYTLVVEQEEHILGFANLESDGCIDMFYVNATTQNQGVGSYLYAALQDEAKRRGFRTLHSDVSLTARQFFFSKGFVIGKEYKKNVSGVDFINAIMTKDL